MVSVYIGATGVFGLIWRLFKIEFMLMSYKIGNNFEVRQYEQNGSKRGNKEK